MINRYLERKVGFAAPCGVLLLALLGSSHLALAQDRLQKGTAELTRSVIDLFRDPMENDDYRRGYREELELNALKAQIEADRATVRNSQPQIGPQRTTAIQAAEEISRLERYWESTDLDYELKRPAMLLHAQRIFETHPPKTWVLAISAVYVGLSDGIALERKRQQGTKN